jgi:hypothetical protein
MKMKPMKMKNENEIMKAKAKKSGRRKYQPQYVSENDDEREMNINQTISKMNDGMVAS